MSSLENAISLATMGFRIFPLGINSKKPILEDFPNVATTDKETITKWWVRPYNVGISTENLIVIDVDNKKGKNGSETLLKLELDGKEFPKTFTQTTVNGGEHLIYKCKNPVKQGVDVLGNGLDIRSKGGYIVGPGSVIDGKTYKASIKKLAECPEWIVKICGAPGVKSDKIVDVSSLDTDAALQRAKTYLLKDAPLAMMGDGGDITCYKVAASIKDYGVDQVDALELLLEHWNDRCEPPWGLEELEAKVNSAYKYGQEPVGAKAAELDFDAVENTGEKSFLEQMNDTYALIFGDAKHSILEEAIDEKGRPRRVFMTEAAFRRKLSPYIVEQGGKARPKSFAEIWLDWEGRRQYNGVCFRPELEAEHGYYNTWRGFVYKPKAYDLATKGAKLGFDMFMEHALENVCGNNEDLFEWLMSYFAHLIQKPYEKPLTTLVFKGRKGVGKNALIDRIGKLLGRGHYTVAHDGRYLTSNFNGHMDSCLCLVLDEAFWSGDKGAEGKLKGLSTSPEIMIERKGKEPYMIDNMVRIMIIGNEDWLVPASTDERRYAVFTVGDKRARDNSFFEKMTVLMDQKGGAEVLMDYLKNRSIVDINTAPDTEGLYDQKIASLDVLEQFWYECLCDGNIFETHFTADESLLLQKDLFMSQLKYHFRDRNIRSRFPTKTAITQHFKRISPSFDSTKRLKAGEEWKPAFKFSNLKVCRSEWDVVMDHESTWPEI